MLHGRPIPIKSIKMNKKISAIFILLFSVFNCAIVKAAEDPFLQLLKKLEAYTKNYPQEKVHLHLDKPYYAIGDDIWFKAYIVDTKTLTPTQTSNTLRVELIGPDHQLKKQLLLPINNGATWGDIKLSDTLTEGNYSLKAYTQWMGNAGSEFFFEKMIKVGNSWTNKVFTNTTFSTFKKANINYTETNIAISDESGRPTVKKEINYQVKYANKSLQSGKIKTDEQGEIKFSFPSPNNPSEIGNIFLSLTSAKGEKIAKIIPIKVVATALDVQFFPEGGNLVEGLVSKIAIKAINNTGLGTDISGKIVDNEDAEVASFQTIHLGMGSFFFSPLAGKSYHAKVTLADGTTASYPLPKAKASGVLLTVNNSDTAKINIKLTLSADMLNKGEINLVAHKNGKIFIHTTVPSTKQVTKVVLAKDQFPSGIIQLSLFTNQNIPIAERILFIANTADRISFKAKQLATTYKKREQIEVLLNASIEDQPVEGNFSVAVTNLDHVVPDIANESNILTQLLLTSDLKGYIEKPNYYFADPSEKTREDLDHLLLTQGWRKINWDLINQNQPLNPTFKPDQGLTVSGTITKNGKPLPTSKVALVSKSNSLSMLETISDENGKFSFGGLVFADSTRFILQASSEKDKKDVIINLDLLPVPIKSASTKQSDIEININSSLKTYLNASATHFNELGLLSRTILLKEVKIEKEQKANLPYSSNLNGPGNADQIIDVSQLDLANSVGQYLQGRILNVEIRGPLMLNLRNNNAVDVGKPLSNKSMAIALDGMLMGEDFVLGDLYPQTIASIEVLISPPKLAIYGPNGANGVLVVTSKRGGLRNNSMALSPGITKFVGNGYYQAREFYAPKYQVETDSKPDHRTTVFWKPDLTTDDKGEAKISYFNTDKVGTYRIVIEGIDAFGNLARQTYTYQVK